MAISVTVEVTVDNNSTNYTSVNILYCVLTFEAVVINIYFILLSLTNSSKYSKQLTFDQSSQTTAKYDIICTYHL